MKQLFAVLMSFQLIISPLALAQDAPVPDTRAVTNDAYLKTGTGSSGGLDFYTSQIAGIGTSALGASIITQCLEGLKTPSIATFMAGSLVHISSEIIGAKRKNERNKKKISDLELKVEDIKKSGDSAQLESLKAMLAEEEDTLEFLSNRKKWMLAVDAIYAAAVALAVAEELSGLGVRTATAAASCTVVENATALAECAGNAACVPPILALTLPACNAGAAVAAEMMKADVVSHHAARELITAKCEIALAGQAEATAPCVEAAMAEMAVVYGACLPAPADGGVSMFSWPSLLGMAYGFGAGKLSQDGGEISQYGTMAVSLLTAFVPAVSRTVAQLYNFPIPRSITFGALLVLSGINTAGLGKRESISKSNISKLKDGIAQFKLEADGEQTGIGPGEIAGSDDGPNAANIKPNIKKLVVNVPKNCISNSTGKWDISDKACEKPLKLTKTNFGNFSLPALTNVSGLATDMAQALAVGDEKRAYAIAGDIGTMAARVKKISEELKVRYNEEQKKNNKPTVDFNKKIAQQVASIQQSMNQAAAKSNVDLASLGSSSLDKDDTKKKENVQTVTSVAIPRVQQPAADPFAGMGGGDEYTADPIPAEKTAQNLDDYEATEQDVSKKSEVSIFKQLSNRYILNYTKMFERKVPKEANKN